MYSFEIANKNADFNRIYERSQSRTGWSKKAPLIGKFKETGILSAKWSQKSLHN